MPSVRRGLPGEGQVEPAPQGARHAAAATAARARAGAITPSSSTSRSSTAPSCRASTPSASQFLEPLFEYSGACAGCGETPYLKLLTQLFGDRLLIANATGCSSIYGGNLPTTPYTVNRDGRGPAWSNSLFEDNAEFGLGFRLAVDAHREHAVALLQGIDRRWPATSWWPRSLSGADGLDEAGIARPARARRALRERLAALRRPAARVARQLADYLVRKSVWLVGGDGWAYDIGYGGLDHVLAQHRNVNVLVLDTEVYSNTGGQASKATPLGAAAKFATAGKSSAKKDLGMEIMSYGHVYVARVAFGAKVNQVVHALAEADAYPGPSLVIAYSHCIAHGYDLRDGAEQQKLAVVLRRLAALPLRSAPRRRRASRRCSSTATRRPSRCKTYMRNETRFRMVERIDPARFKAARRARRRRRRRSASRYTSSSPACSCRRSKMRRARTTRREPCGMMADRRSP